MAKRNYGSLDQCVLCLKTYAGPTGLWNHLTNVHRIYDAAEKRRNMRQIPNPEYEPPANSLR